MNRRTILAVMISIQISGLYLMAQEQPGTLHLYPIGNLADLDAGSQEIKAIAGLIEKEANPAAILFTGDITKSDLTERQAREQDSLRLHNVLRELESPYITKFIFIPGDRDWAYSGREGWKNADLLEDMIENLPFSNIKWTPGHGCPGPKEVEAGNNLVIVVLNTQYWNHPFEKPSPTDAICKISSQDDLLEELDDLLAETRNKNVVVAGHFPALSSGEYGGRMDLKKHLFPLTDANHALWIPLPFLGSFYPAFRQNIGSQMDIINAHYEEFNLAVRNVFRDHPGVICISGHDYIRQLIYQQNAYFLNSGSMSVFRHEGKIEGNVLSGKGPGLIRLEFEENGNVNATGFLLRGSELEPEESIELFRSACLDQSENVPVNEYYAPCRLNTIFPEKMSLPYDGEVPAAAGEAYAAGVMKKLFFGRHYRDTWTVPVRTHYLNLDTTFGGLTPIKRGGGRQTTSLKFRAGNGCEYVFRSVDKDPKKALSYELRETIVADVVRDQTTTQQPYGALATKQMMDELGILHPSPDLYLLPPDGKLGPFRKDYAGLFGMLEESPRSPAGMCPGFGGADEVIRSYKLFRNLYDHHKYRVDELEFAKARVFDIFVGDWGRHEDNWKWAGYESGEYITYRPVPRDRDHVFSVWDGLLPWIADREWAKPSGEHFGKKIRDVKSLTWSARHLDRILLTGVDREDWLAQSEEVKTRMSDGIIESSVRNMPEEVYEVSGKEIIAKLKVRRDNLDKYILEYYRLLTKYTDVIGSSEKEVFTASRMEDGSVKVSMTDSSGDRQLYDRVFYPDETKEIRLYGLGSGDVFRIRGESRTSILLRIVGGRGADSITDDSKVKGCRKMTRVYEKDPGCSISTGTEARMIRSRNEKVYDYDRHAFAYNTYFPLPFLGYNSDDGLILGFGITFKRQRFGREDYSARHSLDVKGSLAGNLQFRYEGQLHHVIGRWDLLYYGVAAYPTDFVYFYGYGNETVRSDQLFREDYYKTRYNSIRLGAGLLREFMKRSSFSVTIGYENNDGQITDHTILDVPQDILGKGKVNLFEGVTALDLDFRNDKKFPERGMRFFGEFVQGLITSNENSTYNKTTAFIEFHSAILSRLPVFIGLKGGGAFSAGDIPFYKLVNIGQNNFLRGYRKNRFAGKSMAFFNSDLKVQILDIATPVVPVKFGIRGFYDMGKVFVDDERSDKLHAGYGGGIYLIPLEKSYSLSMSMAFSEEEKKGLFVLEFGITF